MSRDLLATWHQQANPLSRKALARLPATHFLAIRHNRFVTMLIQKFLYWFFKARNRLEVSGSEYVRRAIGAGEAFVVVANHSGNADVALQQSIQAHYGNLAFTFINGGGFVNQQFPSIAATLYFAEYMPRMGTGQQSVARVVDRLVTGDRILYFPEGTFDYGLVWRGYTGVARIALEYRKATGKVLWFVPSCAIGMHAAYNPHAPHRHRLLRRHKHKRKPGIDSEFLAARRRRLKLLPVSAQVSRPGQKVKVKFGPAFTVSLSDNPSGVDLEAATDCIMLRVASLWGQKKLRPNVTRAWIQKVMPKIDGQRVYTG